MIKVDLYEHKIKLNSQSSEFKLIYEKIQPFLLGMSIYKRFSSNLSKQFDPQSSKQNPPESCGYAQRLVQLNGNQLEFKKERKVEMKISVYDLKSILLTPVMKKMIAFYKSNVSTRPNSTMLISKVRLDEGNEYVQFKLITSNDSVDLIAHNYMAFISFNDAVEKIIELKKNKQIDDFLYLLYK